MNAALLNMAIADMDKAIEVRNAWRIKWRGQFITARGKGAWFSKSAARQAFHSDYGWVLSAAILTVAGKPSPDGRYGQTDTPLQERNHLIDELERSGLLEFIHT